MAAFFLDLAVEVGHLGVFRVVSQVLAFFLLGNLVVLGVWLAEKAVK